MKNHYRFYTNKQIAPKAFAELMASVGWGRKQDYDPKTIQRSIDNHTFVAHVMNDQDQLVAYVSALSDGAFSTFIGELVVHPEHQGKGLGKELIGMVEKRFAGVPVYVNPFLEEKGFFIRQGYSEPQRDMVVVSKRNSVLQACSAS